MAKKYIRGVFELAEGAADLEAFEEKIKPQLLNIVDWATANGIGITFGASEDNTYLCEFDTKARTVQMCKGCVAELKAMLKPLFPKARIVLQYTGDILW